MDSSLHVVGDTRSLDDHLDAFNCTTGVGPPEETPRALYRWDIPAGRAGIAIRVPLRSP